MYNYPVIYSGDFNSHHTTWGYWFDNTDDIAVYDWTNINGLKIMYDPKQQEPFHFTMWNTFTNPDIFLYSYDDDTFVPHSIHTIRCNFSRSKHRLTFINHPALVEYTYTTPIPRWNFNKANWRQFHKESACLTTHFLIQKPMLMIALRLSKGNSSTTNSWILQRQLSWKVFVKITYQPWMLN